MTAPDEAEEQCDALVRDDLADPSEGGRFASFAETLTREEADEMLDQLDREFGKVEGDW